RVIDWIHQHKEKAFSVLGNIIVGYVLVTNVILGIETPGAWGTGLKVLCMLMFIAMVVVSVSETIRWRRLRLISAKAHREFEDQVRVLEQQANAERSDGPAT
ncbi:MAG: hypothetical protein AAGE01_11640, partial [Pseudomonadota bacterium]